MNFSNILFPIVSHTSVQDVDALEKIAKDGDWNQSLTLKWVTAIDILPCTISKAFGYVTEAVIALALFYFKEAFTNVGLSVNLAVQSFGYAVSLFPSFLGRLGFSLVDNLKGMEHRWALYHYLEKARVNVRQYSFLKKQEKEKRALDALDKLKDELKVFGHVTSDSFQEFSSAYKSYLLCGETQEKIISPIRSLAIKLSPEKETYKQKIEHLPNEKGSLISSEKGDDSRFRLKELDLERIFSVMHGDFTGSNLNPPSAKHLDMYVLSFIRKIREGDKPHLKEETHLDLLETRLKTTLELEKFREECSGDPSKFQKKLLEKLVTEKTVSVASGYQGFPVGHRTYITFHLEERHGKQWVSGEVINLGEGTIDALFFDANDRMRVYPERKLRPALLEDVQNSFFWKAFLELDWPLDSSGGTTGLEIADFNKVLLSEWPGGVGPYQNEGKKLQYSGSCEFAALKHVIKELLPPEYGKLFVHSLYTDILEDYVVEKGVTEENIHALKEASAHLARLVLKSPQKSEPIWTPIQANLSMIDRGIQAFELSQKARCSSKCFDWTQVVTDNDTNIGIKVCPNISSSKGVIGLPQGSLNDRLEYYLSLDSFRTSGRDRACIFRRGLEEIPSINDPIWESAEATELCENLTKLTSKFTKALTERDIDEQPAHFGPDDVALLFKSYAALFKMNTYLMGDQAVKDFYLSRMKAVIQSNSLYLLRPTHPVALAGFTEAVDYLLEQAKNISSANNISLMEIKVKNVSDLKSYPHLNLIYQELQKDSVLKATIQKELKKCDKNRPVTDLECVVHLSKGVFVYGNKSLKKISGLMGLWGNFFSLFALRSTGEMFNYSFIYGGSASSGEYRFSEGYFPVYCSLEGDNKAVFPSRRSDINIACQTNLYLETYQGFDDKEAQKLLPVLKRELPFNGLKKLTENQQLLQNEGLEVQGERLPFYEIQSLLGITTYKDLSVDLIVKHFDRYFPRMKKPVFRTLFQALLTQVFIEKGNTHSLLDYTTKHHPDQIFQLIDFIQRRRVDTRHYKWDETTSFLFWMEGVVLSYLVRNEDKHEGIEKAYQNFLTQTRCLFEREEKPELLQELAARLLSLAPYFEKSAKHESFLDFINEQIGGISDSPNRPLQERRKLDHAYLINQNNLERVRLDQVTRVVNTPSFHGTYEQYTKVLVEEREGPFQGEDRRLNSKMEYFRSEDRSHGLIFKMGETIPSFVHDGQHIELLEQGQRTGLILAVNSYTSTVGSFFKRITSPQDLFLWKDVSNTVIRADYPKLDLSFHFEKDATQRDQGRWMSSKHPGYFLDPHYQSHIFEPASHYLVLRNQKGQRIVYTISAPFEKLESDNTLTKRNGTEVEKREAQSLLVYHLDENQEVDFSQIEHEELIYGIYLALRERNYEKAGLWLHEWEKQCPLHSDETAKLLSFFIGEEDKNPRAVAIRIKLFLSLIHDPLYTLPNTDKMDLEGKLMEAVPNMLKGTAQSMWDSLDIKGLLNIATNDFAKQLMEDSFNYRLQENNVFPFKLSEDELSALADYLPRKEEYLFFLKLTELRKSFKKVTSEDISTVDFYSFSLKKEALENQETVKVSLRPKSPFVDNFFSYYQLAKSLKSDDPRIEELRYLIRASENDPSANVQFGRAVLKGVLEFPYFFPSVETILVMCHEMTNKEILMGLYSKANLLGVLERVIYLIPLWIEVVKSGLQAYQEMLLSTALLIVSQMLLLYLFRHTPNSYFGPFGELCEERFFNLFFRGLLFKAITPAVNWSRNELRKKSVDLKNWVWSVPAPERDLFLKPTTPVRLFSPVVAFNSQFAAPFELLRMCQDEENPYFLTEKRDMSTALATLGDIQATFNGRDHADREPCIQRQHDRFLSGALQKKKEFEQLHGTDKSRINQNNMNGLLVATQIQKEALETDFHAKENLILRMAHRYPLKLELEVRGGLISPLSLEELIVAFGRKDHAKILRSNPSITESELTRIEQLIGEYLVSKTAADRLESVCQKLEKAITLDKRIQETRSRFRLTNAYRRRNGDYHDPVKDQREVDALLKESMHILTAKRVFSGAQNPHLLVFEYFMGMTLRENQVAFLDRLTKAQGNLKALEDILEEAHTGFGKSKVAIPLWLYLTSQSGRIAMITVPEPLLEEMRIHLKRVLGKNFDQGIVPIYFDRSRANDLKYLKYINKVFDDAERYGKCIVMSINSLHGMSVLKHKETYFRQIKEGLSPEYMAELDKVRETLANRVSNFVDESSDCFYIRYSYDYSVGRKKPLSRNHIATTKEMYEFLLQDEALLKEMDFDFLRQTDPQEEQEYIDNETYEGKVLPHLIQKIIAKFNVPYLHIAGVKKSLMGEYGPECEAFLQTLTSNELSKFATLRKQLVTYLRQSLSCRWNERYKLGHDRIAYPARNGKLIPRSQFSSLDLILNFTFQANARTPFTYEHVQQFIDELISDTLTKSQHEFETTVGYQTFLKFSDRVGGLPAFADLKKEHKLQLLEGINRTIQSRLLFTEGFVLPKLEYYPQKIDSYPQLLCNRVGHTQGASGTLIDNVPSRLKLNFDYTTIFKNLLVLWQKSQDQVFTIPKLEGTPLVRHLFQNFNSGFNAIIDIAGYFRGFSSNEEIAREILSITAHRVPPVEAVGFIDEGGRNLILRRGATAPLLRANVSIESDRIFMFYSQEAVVGFDIDLSRETRALVTAGRMTRRDFFMQGVGRLRGLNEGMLASFITIENEMESIREALKLPEGHRLQFKDLFLYCFDLEGEKQGDEAFDVMYHEWLAQIEEIFWRKDLGMPLEERQALFEKLSSFFCKQVFSDPVQSLRVMRDQLTRDEATEEALTTLLESIEKIVQASPELAEEYDVDRMKRELPKQFEKDRLRQHYMKSRGNELQLSFSEVEQEKEKELELDTEQIKNLARDEALRFKTEEPQPLSRPYHDLAQYHGVSKFHPKSTAFISQDLLCTDNFFKIAKSSPNLYEITMKPARYSLVVQNRRQKTYQVVLLDLHDAQFIYKQMEEDKAADRVHSANYDYYLVGNDQMNLLAQNSIEKWTSETSRHPNLKKVMLEARPYTGNLVFDREDQEQFESDKEKASKFFKTVEDRFVQPWPYYKKSVENYAAPSA